MLHYLMTVQSIWNSDPRDAVTVQGLLAPTEGDTRSSVYAKVHAEAVAQWKRRYPRTSIGEVAVLAWSLENETL